MRFSGINVKTNLGLCQYGTALFPFWSGSPGCPTGANTESTLKRQAFPRLIAFRGHIGNLGVNQAVGP